MYYEGGRAYLNDTERDELEKLYTSNPLGGFTLDLLAKFVEDMATRAVDIYTEQQHEVR